MLSVADKQERPMKLPDDHPQRFQLANEVHARPHEPLKAPERAFYPAALLEPRRYLNSGSRPSRRPRSSSARRTPTLMSVVTVDGPWPLASSARCSRSTARSFVYVLPKSMRRAELADIPS